MIGRDKVVLVMDWERNVTDFRFVPVINKAEKLSIRHRLEGPVLPYEETKVSMLGN